MAPKRRRQKQVVGARRKSTMPFVKRMKAWRQKRVVGTGDFRSAACISNGLLLQLFREDDHTRGNILGSGSDVAGLVRRGAGTELPVHVQS
jgi:hypothetical protein